MVAFLKRWAGRGIRLVNSQSVKVEWSEGVVTGIEPVTGASPERGYYAMFATNCKGVMVKSDIVIETG